MQTVAQNTQVSDPHRENHLAETVDLSRSIHLSATQRDAVERAIRNAVIEKRDMLIAYERTAARAVSGGNIRNANKARSHSARLARDIDNLETALAAINPDL
jgi:hypothetical protein